MAKRLAIYLLLIHLSFSSKSTEYQFASIENLDEQAIGEIVLTEVYHRLGYKISITPFSGKRAEYEANEGLKDGEIMRVWSYGEKNKNLIRVPTPYLTLTTIAFVKSENNITLEHNNDLANYNVARVMGLKHTEEITQGMPNVVEANSTVNMLQLLEQNIVDIALTDYIDGMWALSKLKREHNIIVYPRPLAYLGLYHYLHKKHIDLVEKVDREIKAMKISGELAKITQKARNEIFVGIPSESNFY
ncbi:substrate-binding periplasmic protein [Thalassotalea profundi]|uniref:ABC transporter substrate-binding protein n=1 Tax=Thalassotalea profundi TaxID=2036687 RepID=A0ABQ3ILC2_9GAMM|nr:transporter substrate-binding domain-containing protein [Thalassotalea profundi]GHE87788.1 ABC transporter substrate-binding protein [Thalassotalea profundi]